MHFFFKNKSTIKILFVNTMLLPLQPSALRRGSGVGSMRRSGAACGGGQPYVCNTSRYRYYTITKLVVLFKVIDTYIVFMCAVYVLCNRAVGKVSKIGG